MLLQSQLYPTKQQQREILQYAGSLRRAQTFAREPSTCGCVSQCLTVAILAAVPGTFKASFLRSFVLGYLELGNIDMSTSEACRVCKHSPILLSWYF